MSMQKKTICPLDCPDSCGLLATIKEGKVVALGGDKNHPVTNGFICRKMRRYPERLYGGQRILYPMLRIGSKGVGSFRRISWPEALNLLADRLSDVQRRFGGEAILPYCYAGNMGMLSRFSGFPLFHRLGASHLEQTICSAAAGAGWSAQCGDLPGCPPENAGESDLIVAWGINVKVTNIHFWQYIAEARRKGGQLLVIDPYRNDTAKSADRHLSVLPGGDLALALAVIKVLLELSLVDSAKIARETEDFPELAREARLLQWPRLEAETGLLQEEIKELAVLLAKTPKTFLRIGIGLSRHSRGGMAVRAIASLAAILGLFAGGPGRGVLLTSGGFRGDKSRLTWPSLAPKSVRTVNMIQLGHALTALKPPVKALFVYNANPACVNPDAGLVRQGLLRDDLFTVVHEQVMTPTARYADLVLPATTFLENLDLYTAYGHFYLGVAHPVIEPVGEARSNFDLFQALAKEMGFTDPPFQQSCEDRIRDYLATLQGLPATIDLDAVLGGELILSTESCADGNALAKRRRPFRFRGESSFAPSSIASLIRAGDFADPDLLARFPLRLISPPHVDLLNSTFGEMHKGKRGEVLIHPTDAGGSQVVDGQLVTLTNHRGRCSRIARVTEDTRPGVLVAEGLFWSVDQDDSVINDLTSQKLADLGGGATFHEALVTIVPADPGTAL